MKLLYYLPAFGNNNLEIKYNILIHNLYYIYNKINKPFDICINFYTISDDIKVKLKSLSFINELYIYEKEGGILTELFLTNPYNIYISNYDYVLFVLDDVKIMDLDLKNMIEIKEKYNIEILSPKILKSTYDYMNNLTDLAITNFIEVYLLLLRPKDLINFFSLHTIKNKWMWGIDLLFGYHEMKAGILYTCVCEHVLPSNSNHDEARYLMKDYLKTYTKYNDIPDIIKEYPIIIEKIKIDKNNKIIKLEELVDNLRSDKNTVHSYLPLYQKLLINKKETAKNVLEIGILYGGSIKLWSDFFTNATVYGLDIININNVWEEIRNKEKIILYTSTDAYNNNFFINNFLNKNIKFDFMLDDGPHTLESMKQFIKLYSQIMTNDGILIIEDIQAWEWIDILKKEVPENLKQFIKIYDLRQNKNRYDDIVFTIDKSNI